MDHEAPRAFTVFQWTPELCETFGRPMSDVGRWGFRDWGAETYCFSSQEFAEGWAFTLSNKMAAITKNHRKRPHLLLLRSHHERPEQILAD